MNKINLFLLLVSTTLIISCGENKPVGNNQPPTTTNVTVLLPFFNISPSNIDRQINYKAKVFIKTGADPNGALANYGSSPYINNVSNSLHEYPSRYEKDVDVPTNGFFNAQVLLEYIECSEFHKLKEWEGMSPIIALPVPMISIDNVIEIWQSDC